MRDCIIIGGSEDGTQYLSLGGSEGWHDNWREATPLSYHVAVRLARKLQRRHSTRRYRWLYNVRVVPLGCNLATLRLEYRHMIACQPEEICDFGCTDYEHCEHPAPGWRYYSYTNEG